MAPRKATTLENLVTRRVKTLEYIRDVIEGRTLWVNVARIEVSDITGFYFSGGKENLEKRVQQWFHLGLNLAQLLTIPNGHPFVAAADKIVEDWGYHFGGSVLQSMRVVSTLTKTAVGYARQAAGTGTTDTAPECTLAINNVPFTLDYVEVVNALVHVLILVYQKLIDDSSTLATTFALITQFDGRLKNHFFGPISNDLSTIAMAVVRREAGDLLGEISLPQDARDRIGAPEDSFVDESGEAVGSDV
eukprot:TRINITY_DN27796_c0_g1_i1.p1 TRINITY_DN27796_c0_g1~~TRINITY_DN27796_c0_g1_i1.p1  ORF type:complete len:262 (+),score=44.61 TRINITY_DN27796_c0_g1_i1:47-787(+)